MRAHDIENSIAREIRETTPDMLESLMEELELGAPSKARETVREEAADTKTGASANRKRGPKAWALAALPIAAIIALVAVGVMAISHNPRDAFAIVGLDVNPSIELSVDADEHVISVSALNDDASAVLDGLDLVGTDLNTASYAVIGSMLVKGYLNPDANSILVSVRATDEEAGKQLEQKLSTSLGTYVQNSGFDVSIFGQFVGSADGLQGFAADNDVSVGKAHLIHELASLGVLKSGEESLAKLSTQELVLLARERGVQAETVIGEASARDLVSKADAARIALEDARVANQDASLADVELDCEDGALVYEVEFADQGAKWEYEIDAHSGKIIESKQEPMAVVPLPIIDAEGDGPDDDRDRDDDDLDDGLDDKDDKDDRDDFDDNRENANDWDDDNDDDDDDDRGAGQRSDDDDDDDDD